MARGELAFWSAFSSRPDRLKNDPPITWRDRLFGSCCGQNLASSLVRSAVYRKAAASRFRDNAFTPQSHVEGNFIVVTADVIDISRNRVTFVIPL